MKRIILAFTILTFVPTLTHAGWWRTYGGGGRDGGIFGFQTQENEYMILASTSSFGALTKYAPWVLSIDTTGDTLWTRIYEEEGTIMARSLTQTQGGNYILAGTTGYEPKSIWFLKIDSLGNILWKKTYALGIFCQCGEVSPTSDGFVLAGTVNPDSGTEVLLMKLDEHGDSLWTKTYAKENASNYAESVYSTSDGGYIIAAHPYSFDTYTCDYWLIRTDENGDSLWSKTYDNSDWDVPYCIKQTADGGFIVTGQTEVSAYYDDYDAWVVKTDSSGEVMWSNTYTGFYEDFSHDIAVCVEQVDDGDYILAGSMGNATTEPHEDIEGDAWLFKLDESGSLLWSRKYGHGRDYSDWAHGVSQTWDGGYLLCGATEYQTGGETDVVIIKTDANGDTLGFNESTPTHQPDWQVLTPIGSTVTLRSPKGSAPFELAVFDAAGRMVDQIHLSSGTITWGECYRPGVYFIRQVNRHSKTLKVILIK